MWPSAALASCLAARAFRRELVLLTESRLAPAYQTFANLLDVGYEHVVGGRLAVQARWSQQQSKTLAALARR